MAYKSLVGHPVGDGRKADGVWELACKMSNRLAGRGSHPSTNF
jgi:hypothetical protein